MRNFEKIRTNKDRRAAGEIVDSHRRRKKTQKRGSAESAWIGISFKLTTR